MVCRYLGGHVRMTGPVRRLMQIRACLADMIEIETSTVRRNSMKLMPVLFAACMAAVPALAQEPVTYTYDGSYDDATFAVETAIVNQGLVIDYVSHVGDMLNRTGEDVGSDTKLFDNAQIFLFCSAVVSREVMEADPMNIQHCPYGIFVAEREGTVTIGHRDYPDGAMDKVEALLDGIIQEAMAE